MLHRETNRCCQNCENLRIDNYCLLRNGYILSKEILNKTSCSGFIQKDLSFSKEMITEKKTRLEQIKALLLSSPNVSSLEE
jgi:hypothetical protein